MVEERNIEPHMHEWLKTELKEGGHVEALHWQRKNPDPQMAQTARARAEHAA
jgi:hypothetical protein